MACDRTSGKLLWAIDLVLDYGAEIPDWHSGQCPLILDGVAILAPAGKDVLLMGVDARTGEILWTTPNPGGWKMSHTSVAVMEFDGVKTGVYLALGGVAGISLEGPNAGTLVFHTDEWAQAVIVPSPVQLPGNRILLTAGYGAGGALLQLEKQDGEKTYSVDIVDKWLPPQGISSEQQTPILVGEHLYAVLPKSAARYREQLACYHISNLRRPVWSSKQDRFGMGPFMVINNRLFVVDDHATLTIVELNPEKYQPLLRTTLLEDAHDSWGPLAVADGMLIVREMRRLACVDLNTLKTVNP